MVLVDSSVWIDYFNGRTKEPLQTLLNNNQVCVSDVMLAEVLPILIFKKSDEPCNLLLSLPQCETKVTWKEAMEAQVQNLKYGINGINLLDILIALNAKKNNLAILTFDKHFALMQDAIGISVYKR